MEGVGGLTHSKKPAAGPGPAPEPPGKSARRQRGVPAYRRGPEIAPAGDEREREADRVAAATRLVGPRGASAAPIGNAGDAGLPVGDGGTPLTAELRGRIESVLDTDLGAVRLHATTADRRLAASLGARAFTRGRHIWLGPRGRADDVGLLAHEAAHVAQQRDTPAEPLVQRFPEESSFDPEEIPLATMTISELLEEEQQVTSFLSGHEPDDPRHASVDRLRVLIDDERTRRIDLGYLFLSELRTPQSIPLYTFDRSGDNVAVTVVPDAEAMLSAPIDRGERPIVTVAQFQEYLESQGIPTISTQDYLEILAQQRMGQASDTGLDDPAHQPGDGLDVAQAGMIPGRIPWLAPGAAPDANDWGNAGGVGFTAGRGYVSPWARTLNQSFTQNPASPGWIGPAAEAYFQVGQPGSLIDTNTLPWRLPNGQPWAGPPRSFPVIDYASPDWQLLYDSKMSGRPVQADRLRWYASEIGDDLTARQLTSLLARNVPGNPSRQQLFDRLRPVLPPDDVAAFQAALQNPEGRLDPTMLRSRTIRGTAGFRSIYDNILQIHPETVPTVSGGTRQFSTLADLEAAQRAGTIADSEVVNALARAGARLATQSVPGELSTTAGRTLLGQRSSLGGGPGSVLATRVFDYSEYLAAQRVGEIPAATSAARVGALGGGLISVTVGGISMLIDSREHPNWAQELAVTGAVGTASGAAGGATQQYAASRLGGYLIQRGAQQSLATGLFARMGSGAVGGGVASLVGEWIQMGLLEDRPHSGREIALRSGRAFVIGAVSGAIGTAAGSILGAAIAGTAIGSAVPGLGTAIGFFVGLGIGIGVALAADSVIPRPDPDIVEPTVAPGAPRSEPDLAPTPRRHGCFTGDTRIRMADGTERPIRDLRPGDVILAYDTEARRLSTQPVNKTFRYEAQSFVEVRLEGSDADGRPLRVTDEHPIYAGGLWVAARTLIPGVIVTRVDAAGRIETVTVASVRSARVPEPVYNLSVSELKTYFAESVLVHNLNK